MWFAGLIDEEEAAIFGKREGNKYYITVGSDTAKHKDYSDIYINQRNSSINLTLNRYHDSIPMDDLSWEVDGDQTCSDSTCSVSLRQATNLTIKISQGEDEIFKTK